MTYQMEAELQRPQRGNGDQKNQIRRNIVQTLSEAMASHRRSQDRW